jgi:CheY-like chemotaxis protein
LLKERCRIVEAPDGRSGIEQAREHRPDLILMDVAMPVMDGIQALKEIRRDPALRHIPVIAVTASAMKGDQETILAHGFDGYLAKPIDAALLIKTLTEALD